MSDEQWKILTDYSPIQSHRRLLIRRGRTAVLPFTFEPLELGAIAPVTLDNWDDDAEGFLRAALNCAWDAGMRPDGYLDTRESMTATATHLEDMRAIAFGKLGVAKP